MGKKEYTSEGHNSDRKRVTKKPYLGEAKKGGTKRELNVQGGTDEGTEE